MKNTVKKLFCLALCAVLLLPAGAQIAERFRVFFAGK